MDSMKHIAHERIRGIALRRHPRAGALWIMWCGFILKAGLALALSAAQIPSLVSNGSPLVVESPAAKEKLDASLPVLTRIVDIRHLDPQELRRGYPVRLKGVVTYRDPVWNGTVLQDETGGIFLESHARKIPVEVPPSAGVPELGYGSFVEVTGITDPGGFSPVVIEPHVRILGPGTLPDPKPVTFEKMATGQEDCTWVETTGIVRAVHNATEGSLFAREHLLLVVAAPGGKFKAWIPNWQSTDVPLYLVDSRVTLRGVCGASANDRGQFQGIDMLIPHFSEIKVKEPAPANPFDIPTFPINRLLRYSTNVIPDRRVKVAGIVTHHRPGKEMYIKDDTLGLHVLTLQTNQMRPGMRVEIIGFVDYDTSGTLLDGATFRPIGTAPPPTPIRLDAEMLVEGKCADELVQVDGVLLSAGQQGDQNLFVLRSGQTLINVEIEYDAKKTPLPSDGSLLRLSGIHVVELDPLYKWPQRFRILVRSPEDIQVLHSPSWWTVTHLSQALALVCGVTLFGGFWLMMLSQKNLALRKAESALQKSNSELELRVRERTAALSLANESLKEQIQARARVEEQLQKTLKLEAVGQLAGGVAHDFNSIFSAMLLNLGMLQSDPRFGLETHAMIADLQAQARRAASLTRQLLMYGQKQIIQPQKTDLNEIVRRALQTKPRVVSDQIQVQLNLKKDLPSAEVDPSLIEQALLVLLHNANDAMPQGGQLTIRSECVSITDDHSSSNPDTRPGHYARISISDTGNGMDPTTLKRVFEPFFTTKDVGKGTGLGLASVYGIVKQHNGWIEVQSKIGQGSTFQIYLPAPILETNRPSETKKLPA